MQQTGRHSLAPSRPQSQRGGPTISLAQALAQIREMIQRKDSVSAEAAYQRLARQFPQQPDVLRGYGVFKLQNNDNEIGCDYLERCLRLAPEDAVAKKFLGLGRTRQQRHDKAVGLLQAATQALPKDPDSHYFLAQAYGAAKRHDEAIASINQALKLRPEYPIYLNSLSVFFSQKGQDRRSLPVLYRALDLAPENWSIRLTLGHVLMRLGRHKEAISHYIEVMQDSPDRVDVLSNMGNAYAAIEQVDQAESYFEKLKQLYPNDATVHQSLANLYSRQNRYDEALACYQRAIELQPNYPEALNNYAITLRRLNRVQDSLVQLERAVELRPEFADARWNLSLSQLLLGDLRHGFESYEWRWRGGVRELRPRQLGAPVWERGQDITGKRLYVHSEQGLGDHLQYIRYLPRLLEMGAAVVYAEFPEPLIELCRANYPQIQWVERGNRNYPVCDLVCPLMSLSHRLGTELDTIPVPGGYLDAAAEKVEFFRSLLRGLDGLKVGLVWSGNPKHQNDKNRSMTLAQLLDVLPTDGVSYVSLMKEMRPHDQEVLRESGRVLDISDKLDSFMDTAALIRSIDLVVTVDTSVAHLAGALGAPVWVLVPFAPDWRWLLDRSDTPWYRSMTLFRQHAPQDWTVAMERLGLALAARLSHR